MILVLLGTQDKQFDRLICEVGRLKDNGIIKDDVIAQLGFTKYSNDNITTFDLISSEELLDLTKKADLIITHGGVGSILSALKLGKKIIAVPRLAYYGEHTNDHQIQIVNEFYKTGYILKCDNPTDLEKVLKKVIKFKPKEYRSNTKNMIKLIENYIDGL